MQNLTRRQLLIAGLGVAAMSAIPGCGQSTTDFIGQQPVTPVPPVAPRIVEVNLDVKMATNVVDGLPFIARSYDGIVSGHTIRVRPGDNLRVKVRNQLPPNPDGPPHDINIPHQFNTTNLHVHGLHVSPLGNSDNIFIEIAPGETFDYSYQIPDNHPAGTFWYHPHKHGSSAMQLFSGMAGLLIVEGDIDEVPEIKAAREVPFLINELMQGADGQVPDYSAKGAFVPEERKFTVNGASVPTIRIRPGEVQRWRVCNGAVSWNVPFSIEGHTLHTIAYDGITYPQVLDVDRELLSPGNRVDVLVRGGAPGTYKVLKLEQQQVDPAFGPPALARTPEVHLATLIVEGEPLAMTLPTLLPAPASLPTIQDNEITNRRGVVYSQDFDPGDSTLPFPDRFTIDNKKFDPNRVDQVVQLGAVEEWTITNPMNDTEHPFHIHQNPFQVVMVNGQAVPPRWQDTVNLPRQGSVTIRTRFEDFTGLFVNHCHFLAHEDQGMMQIVSVV